MSSIRVLVADDSQYMNVACRRILETQDHIKVVGTAADGEDAVNQALELSPDVVVLDVRMPGRSGIDAARLIAYNRPGTGAVMMSNYDDPEYVVELLRDGAAGKAYLLKSSVEDVEQLIRAVEAVAAGRTLLDTAIVDRLIRSHANSPDLLFRCLSTQEEDVLSLMHTGSGSGS